MEVTIHERKTRATSGTTSGLTHECGVFGIVTNADEQSLEVAQLVYLSLCALQHRGQESAGIVTSDGKSFHAQKGMGLVRNVFNAENIKKLTGGLGIGHTRYSTSAASESINCQPFVVHSRHGPLALAHNGELINHIKLRESILEQGLGLSTCSDSELITQGLCLNPPEGEVNGPDWPARIKHFMQLSPLSYSMVIMLKDRIYAVRDPFGNRPMCIGRYSSSGDNENSTSLVEGWAVSSESTAFCAHIKFEREVLPGEILEMTKGGVRTIDVVRRPNNDLPALCIFEYVYFARPESHIEGQEVFNVRVRCGRQLALEHPVDADIVGSVPESGNAAAYGYSLQSGIPYGELLSRRPNIGRTFIQPNDYLRKQLIALKFSPLTTNVKGKRVILIDDSIVRGNTIGPIIKLLRNAGAKEVHIRIASPPLRYPCYMGINIPTRKELIANTLESEDLSVEVGANSLWYLSVDGLIEAVQKDIAKDKEVGHCTACMTGKYPVDVPKELSW